MESSLQTFTTLKTEGDAVRRLEKKSGKVYSKKKRRERYLHKTP